MNKAAASPKKAPGLIEAETRKGEEGREEGREGGVEEDGEGSLWWLVLRLLLLFLHLPMPQSCEGEEEEEGEEGGGEGFCR